LFAIFVPPLRDVLCVFISCFTANDKNVLFYVLTYLILAFMANKLNELLNK